MLKVNRKSEYALMTVQHLAGLPAGKVMASQQLAEALRVPEDLLAKVLQGLKRAKILVATKGAGGGYRLACTLDEMLFVDVIGPFEDHMAMVSCCETPVRAEGSAGCERADSCAVRQPITALNQLLHSQMAELTMQRFLGWRSRSGPASPFDRLSQPELVG